MFFNPFQPLTQNIQDIFHSSISKDDERKDEKMECLQFGICAVQVKSPRPEELFFR
tara:strand:- start:1040 stop:1207 length:168 start_codon:yes stop_codon:yes gene_type:complete